MKQYIKRISVVLIFILFIIMPIVKFKKVNEWTCAYTGSQKGNLTWFWFIKTSHWSHTSALEKWLKANKKVIKHRWIRTRGTNYSLFSSQPDIIISPPPIYYLIIVPGLDEQFIETSTSEQIDLLFKFLNTGTRAEQNKVIEKIFDVMKKRNKNRHLKE